MSSASVRRISVPHWLAPAALAVLFAVALLLGLVISPPDVVLGDTVRIFYIHVSVAWVAIVALGVNFVGSVLYLVRRDLRVDRWAGASAEIGTVFTTALLGTGSVWARVAWGTWWTWDPRLTTALVMWFVYIAYLIVRTNLSDPAQRARVSSVIGIIAFADVPLVYLSAFIWRSIHPELIGPNGNFAMAPLMLWAMFAMLAAVTLLYVLLLSLRVRQEQAADTLRALALGAEA